MSRSLKGKQNTQPAFSLFLLYLLMTCAVYILPLLKFKVPYMLAALIMLVTLVPLLFKDKEWTLPVVLFGLSFLLIMTISLITGVSASLTDAVNNILLKNVRFFLPLLWGSYALRYTTVKQQRLFLLLFTAMILFIYIKTISALESDQWVARILAQGKETSNSEVNRYRLDNVGGFEYSYMMGIVALCLTWGALELKSLWAKLVSVVALVLVFYYIIETMYTTLLVLTFVGVFLLLFFHTKNPIIKLTLIVVAAGILLSMVPLMKYLSTAFPRGSLLNDKFKSFYDALTNQDIGRVGSRPELIAHSLERWLEAPVFGSYDRTSNAHSLVFSTLENTGIVGFVPWTATFVAGYRMLKKVYGERTLSTTLLSVAFFYVLALAFLNPIGYVFEVTIAAFFVVPLWCNILTAPTESITLTVANEQPATA